MIDDKEKTLILLGGGHAHLQALESLARQEKLAGWRVQLVSPERRKLYSGMLPGWVAGHYALEDCAIELDALARRAGADFHMSACQSLDLGARILNCTDGSRLHFDRLSVDTGSDPALAQIPGACEHALPLRPLDGFAAAWPGLVDRILGRCRRFHLVVLGAGAAGVEMALAIHRRALSDGWSHLHITLIGADSLPLDGAAPGARRHMAHLLARRAIHWQGGRRAQRILLDRIEFDQGEPMDFDACLLATGGTAPAWARASGLETGEDGYIRVRRNLQSNSHPDLVLAAGDVAAYMDARPKSGVFAVRAGPVLAHNLRALAEGKALHDFIPQRRALYLVSTADQRAIATWGQWWGSGAWLWRWKDRIDRRFVRRFAPRLI